MKTINSILILILAVCYSCHSVEKTNQKKVAFGIYETIKTGGISQPILDSLTMENIQPENDRRLPIIGYLKKSDTLVFQPNLLQRDIRLLRTAYPVDTERNYYALVMIKPTPSITLADIKRTLSTGTTVEIQFNLSGSRKWAELTKNNIGNMVAFVIGDEIYSMPAVGAEIKNGIALIAGQGDEMAAKKISDELNSSLPR